MHLFYLRAHRLTFSTNVDILLHLHVFLGHHSLFLAFFRILLKKNNYIGYIL